MPDLHCTPITSCIFSRKESATSSRKHAFPRKGNYRRSGSALSYAQDRGEGTLRKCKLTDNIFDEKALLAELVRTMVLPLGSGRRNIAKRLLYTPANTESHTAAEKEAAKLYERSDYRSCVLYRGAAKESEKITLAEGLSPRRSK